MLQRFPQGVTNSASTANMAMYGLPDPSVWHTYFNDFDTYLASEWVVTSVGAATRALTDADGGVLLLTNAAADDDSTFLDKVGESFLLASGKKAFFKARFKVSDATQSDLVIGLQVTDTTPLDVTDGIYFVKVDGSTNLSIVCRKDAGAGSETAVAAVLANDTYVTVGWFYDGDALVSYFVNDVQIGTLDGTSAYLPNTEITVSFGVQNGEAVAKTMHVDFILAALQRG